MGFWSDIGVGESFLERTAFVLLSPVIVPLAAAATAYEAVTGGDAPVVSKAQLEEVLARQQEKDAASAKEREAIVDFAKERVEELQNSYWPEIFETEISVGGVSGSHAVKGVMTESGFMFVTAANAAVMADYLRAKLTFPALRDAINTQRSATEIVDGWLLPLAENNEITNLNQEIIEMKELSLIFQNLKDMA